MSPRECLGEREKPLWLQYLGPHGRVDASRPQTAVDGFGSVWKHRDERVPDLLATLGEGGIGQFHGTRERALVHSRITTVEPNDRGIDVWRG